MKRGMVLGVAVVGMGVVGGQAMALQAAPFSVVEGPITNPANGHQYEVIGSATGGGLDWLTAEADAELLGGHLTTVNDAAENAWIVGNLAVAVPGGVNLSDLPLWIGYSDPTLDAGGGSHAGNFVWADGETPGYTNWNTGTGEPNNDAGIEYYAAINWHLAQAGGPVGTWNDTAEAGSTGFGGTSDGPYYGIVELVPEPASLGVLGLGMVGLMGRRRR